MGIIHKIKSLFKRPSGKSTAKSESHFDRILKQHPEGFSDHYERDTEDKIKSIETRFWFEHERAYDEKLQIDKRIKSCQNAVDTYFELDSYCCRSPKTKKYFEKHWIYFYVNRKFGLITDLTNQLKYLKENRERFRDAERSAVK